MIVLARPKDVHQGHRYSPIHIYSEAAKTSSKRKIRDAFRSIQCIADIGSTDPGWR